MKLLFIVIGVGLAGGCKSSEPCSGKGMEIDPRPTPSWLDPPKAIACHQIDRMTDDENSRKYELGKNPKDAYERWGAQLSSAGWREPETPIKTTERYEREYVRGTSRLRLFCSSHVTDKGWCTLSLLDK